MATKVVMEALSPTMEEGRIARWLKKEGDPVTSGEVLAEVETDKAVMELAARGDGVLRKILVADGGTAEVGAPVAVIAGENEDISGIAGAGKKGEAGEKAEAGEAKKESGEQGADRSAAAKPSDAHAAAKRRPAEEHTTPRSPLPTPQAAAGRVKASPLARRLARDRSIDLSRVEGSGPGGRVIKRDLEGVSTAPSPPSPPSRPLRARTEFEDVPLTQIRKTIARRLAQSIGPIPHFFLTNEVDMESAAESRERLNALGDGPKISFNDIVMKVVAMALMQHRACNAWWQDDHIRFFNTVHLAMAVAVEDGLITPVIRNAEQKALREIAVEAKDLADRARARKLTPDQYTGGTFSVSNLGMFEIDDFTAVINPPEAGIIAVGAITPKPVAMDGAVAVRRRMRLTMSCDHRVIDGATGAMFLRTVKRMLENPLAIVW